jgi:uncharacterized phage protein (TIGR02218 family)
MSKNLPASFSTHLSGTTHSTVELYKISAVGMSLFTYTDSKESVSYLGLEYTPYPIKRSKIAFSTDLMVDQTIITMAKNWGANRGIDINLFSGADLSITRVNKDNPNVDNLLMFDGEVADIVTNFETIEMRSQTLDFLNFEIPRREIQVGCNWKLYDKFCALGLTLFQDVGSVSSSALLGRELISTTFSGQTNDYYTQGFIEMTSGNNKSLKRNVSSHVGMTITVVPNFPSSVVSGSEFKIAPGCRKDIVDCESKFSNLINYGGFPYTPKQDDII